MTAENNHNGLREQPMGELFKKLSDDLSTLVRQELKLAQVEMTEKGKRAGVGAGMFGGAGVVALAALGTLSACLIAALAAAAIATEFSTVGFRGFFQVAGQVLHGNSPSAYCLVD